MELLDCALASLMPLPLEQRNELVDATTYDVEALTLAERARLSRLMDREGTVVVVPPRAAKRPIRHYRNALRFMVNEGQSISAIAVAGGCGSVLGVAALARNVADYYGIDVAGVVTGYGLDDLISEAFGGAMFFGSIDRIIHAGRIAIERLLARTTSLSSAAPALSQTGGVDPTDARFLLPGTSDVGTLYDILTASTSLRLVLGHSRGNVVVSLALAHFVQELHGEHHPHLNSMTIVTLGAVVDIHPAFVRQHQFLGSRDYLGAMNSQLSRPHRVVPGAGHHLNRRIPMPLRVQTVLESVPLGG
jgi:hypothetical protein